ncbi:MAG: RluA family pseudouridine synthase [Faecousia sp.]
MELTCISQRDAKLLSILRRELALSSGLVKRLKYRGAFTVNGELAHTDHPVKIGDTVRVRLDEDTPDYPAEEGELHILYEDEALIAVDKPAGMLVHPSFSRNTGTLANRLLGYYQKTGQPCAVHPVSRLDRDTFGVVLLAKNAHIHAKLCAMSKSGAIEKTYRALVFGCPRESEGLIDAPIARVSETSLLRCIREDGKPARSRYRVLASAEGESLLELQPLTGRTHQLRLHCAYLGCPILGDPQYGTEASRAFSHGRGLFSQQLCAASLRFCHPISEKNVEIRSDFARRLDFLSPADI